MNLLFLSQNMPDANLTRHELVKEMPGLHVDVSPDVQDMARRLAGPDRYSAVLLDSGLHEGDPLAAIKALRAGDTAIAVVCLIEPGDLDSGINVPGIGADDYVVKRPGFIATLPGVLQRACAQYGVSQKLEPKAAPVRRGTTGATCVLLRNIGDANTSPSGASQVDKNGERGSAAVSDSGSLGQTLDVRIRDLEAQREALLGVIRASSESQMHPKEEFASLRPHGEKERRDLDQRLKSVEEQRPVLDGPSHEAGGNSQTVEEVRAEVRVVRDQLGEFESKCRNLEENLHSAQISLAEQAKVLQVERDKRLSETEGLRNQLNILGEQRKTLEGALFNAEERQKTSDERHVAELQRWRTQQDEWEQRQRVLVEERSHMQVALQNLETELAERTEELRVANEQWDLRRKAWMQRLDKVEESFAKIEKAVLLQKAQQEELTERFGADLLKSENTRRELEQELRRADEERAQLQESLRAAEARMVEHAEQLRTEREQWEHVRLMLEQQRDALEARVVHLETARDELAKEHSESLAQAEKSRLAMEEKSAALSDELRLLTDEHNHSIEKQESERSQWESVKYELEQRKAALEEELTLARQSVQKLVNEEEANRSRWEASWNELEQLRLDAGSAHALAHEAAERYLLQLNKLRELAGGPSGQETSL